MKRSALLVSLVFLSACGPFRSAGGGPAVFQNIDERVFRYRDRHLELTFAVAEDQRQFRWRFKNLGGQTMILHHKDMALFLQGSEQTYTFWGEKFEARIKRPALRIPPGKFLSLHYPVRFRSPFWPFSLKQDREIRVELAFEKGEQRHLLQIRFPVPEGDQELILGKKKEGEN